MSRSEMSALLDRDEVSPEMLLRTSVLEGATNNHLVPSQEGTPLKLATVLGTRPDIIRLSRIIPKLDAACEHVLIHTGQSFDENMSGVFFKELGIRDPNYNLGVGQASDSAWGQVGSMFQFVGAILSKEKPDRLLVLGDTNSGMAAYVAKRMGIRVYHMEAGNRCFDDRVPEEVNRRVIDQCSDVLMPYTERARANLLREGFSSDRIFVTGNPINEVISNFRVNLEAKSTVFERMGLTPGAYFLVTSHRQENVDIRDRLHKILDACNNLHTQRLAPVVFSRHPRTAKNMANWGFSFENITFYEPFGFADFLNLETQAACILTDSGTVQEEACIMGVPCVTLRDVTERPETIECGSNILAGVEPESVLRCVKLAMQRHDWIPPTEYLRENVSDTVVNIVVGY